jgi:hypothetical protein
MCNVSCSVKDAKTINCSDPGRNSEHRLKIKVKPNGSPKDVVQDVFFGGTAKELRPERRSCWSEVRLLIDDPEHARAKTRPDHHR